MRYTLDTEFFEHAPAINLISIALVAEDGREFYAENHDFDWTSLERLAASDDQYVNDTPRWLLANVKPHLHPACYGMWPDNIKRDILEFVDDDLTPEFWAYFADYDWVVFCQLLGRMVDLPRHWPKYCLDIKQAMRHYGADPRKDPNWPKIPGTQHNALDDARGNMLILEHLDEVYRTIDDFINFDKTRPTPRTKPH